MPGIVGVIGPAPPADSARHVAVMVSMMNHGADLSTGMVAYAELGACFGWAAHPGSLSEKISTQAGPQRLSLLLAGEYTSASDPVECYQSEGDEFVRGLNGLFAGVLVDPAKRRILLFNDRYGSERLYFHERAGLVYFASEARALLSVLPELRALDDAGVAEFLAYGGTFGGRTLFRGVELLPGATLWRFERWPGGRRTRYFLPAEWETQATLDEASFSTQFEQAFAEVLPAYFPMAGRIGISITGGLDTRMIMACRPRMSEAVCYTYAAAEGETLDVKLGRRIAEACGLEHRVLRLGPDFLTDFARNLDETVWSTDGCAGVLGAHELTLSRLAREVAPVRLTGNFGSEVLRGMSTDKPLGLTDGLIHHDFRPRLSDKVRRHPDVHPVTHAAFEEIPHHLFGTLAAARAVLTVRTPYLDNRLVRLAYAAPPDSRQSPGSAIDLIKRRDPALARIPTDRGLVPAMPESSGRLVRLLQSIAFKLDYLDKEGLPGWMSGAEPAFRALSGAGVLGLHKFLAYRRWFRNELAGYAREVLTDPRTARMPYWEPGTLAAVIEDHVTGRRNRLKDIHAVMTLEAVQRVIIDEVGPAAARLRLDDWIAEPIRV